jgi:crossover junction endodeoxyribonuclease RuvC
MWRIIMLLDQDVRIGIDLGLTGAIAVYHPVTSKIIGIHDMPVKMEGTKRRVCEHQLCGLLAVVKSELKAKQVIVESVHAMHLGSQANFSMGHGAGMVAGLCVALGLDRVQVAPRKWKGHYNLTKDKESALALARLMFGFDDLTRKKDHNRAEAMLLASLPLEVLQPPRSSVKK